jgi:hypothetical protein
MNNNLKRYKELNRAQINNITKIVTHVPEITEKDYKRGYITRTFLQKSNDNSSPIYEINQESIGLYTTNPYYVIVNIKWRITGPKKTQYDNIGNIKDKGVLESNRISISLVKDRMPNLKLYLANLLQFYKS